jgi:RNA polymerase sigma-70 factor (ECF subfamily)
VRSDLELELPVDQQMLLEMHYWEGVEIGELAELFGSPAVTVRSRLHRARNALRDRMVREPDALRAVGDTLESLDAWARSLSNAHD